MTTVGIITQARMTSTRLPGKVLLRSGGRTMLDHHLDRLAGAALPIVVATTTNSTDDVIVDAGRSHGVQVYRGSEHDVLSRFAGAAADAGLDTVVRVTSDCPLIDPALIRIGVDRFAEMDDPTAYVSNVIERTYPRGFDFEVFSAAVLNEADQLAEIESDREHVTPYLNQNRTGRTRFSHVVRQSDASHHRVTLDTPDDLTLIRALIEDHEAAGLTVEQIIDVLESHPALARINAHVEQKKLGQ